MRALKLAPTLGPYSKGFIALAKSIAKIHCGALSQQIFLQLRTNGRCSSVSIRKANAPGANTRSVKYLNAHRYDSFSRLMGLCGDSFCCWVAQCFP